MENKLTEKEIAQVKSKIDRGYFVLARTYAPFLLALVLAYFYTKPKAARGKITESDYEHIYMFVFGFFLIVFSIFAIRDYRRSLLPIKQELKNGNKRIIPFTIKKYFDPIYKRCLLYHPVKDGKYLLLTEEVFGLLHDGQTAELLVGSITGTIFSLKVDGKEFIDIDEFSY